MISKKVKIHRFYLYVLIIIAFMGYELTSCKKSEDSTSHGTIAIASDESLQPMVEQITQAYQHTYPETHFNVLYQPEQIAISMVLRDSVRLAFITRELTSDEQKNLKSQGIRYNPQHIATDGVALLTNRSNTDSLITIQELSSVFNGETKTWEELKGGNQKGSITLVFDNANSSNLNYVMTKFGLTNIQGINIFSAGSNKAVIEYVRQNPRALGFIGVNWLSDGDAPLTAELSQGLRVMGVASKADATLDEYYQPFQEGLGLKRYPLSRKVYVISREMHSGLGSGLLNYIMRDVGSLIIEKCGLWPAKPFNREVILKKEI